MSASMDLDPEGNPHIAYLDFAGKNLKYARLSGRKFETEHLTGAPSTDKHVHVGPPHGPAAPSLKVDSKGVPHVAFLFRQGDLPKAKPEDSDGLQYATRVDGKWKISMVDAGSEVGFCPTLVIGPDDRLHISYASRKDSTVRYAVSDDKGGFKTTKTLVHSLWAPEEPGGSHMALAADGRALMMCWTETGANHAFVIRTLEPPR
jgi:hypothetical protein